MARPTKEEEGQKEFLENYMKKTQRLYTQPKDQFALHSFLIANDYDDVEWMEMLSKDLELANINDDYLMSCFQIDIDNISFFGTLAKSDERLKPLYKDLCLVFLGQLRMTNSKNALGRRLAGSPNGIYGDFQGIGMPYDQEQQQGGGGGILDKINPFKGKKILGGQGADMSMNQKKW